MANFAPQYPLYAVIGTLRKTSSIFFWVIFALSVLSSFYTTMHLPECVTHITDVANIILILVFFAIDSIVDLILIPQASQKRRDDLIDNSFDTKFSIKSSNGYFDNDEVDDGIYKCAVNLFENCFFTFNVAKAVTVKKIIVPSLVLISIWVSAYFGFLQVPFFLSLLQLLFSANVATELVKHLILVNKLNIIQDDWIKLFQTPNIKADIERYVPNILRNWLNYESLITKVPANTDTSTFIKHNAQLTNDWAALKNKYNIH